MKLCLVHLALFVLASSPSWSAPADFLVSESEGTPASSSFVNGTWDIKDNQGNKTGTVTIQKTPGETGRITVTDNNGNTYTGTVSSAGSGHISYNLSPSGSPMGSSGTIIQSATPGTLSFNNFDIPGTDYDGTLSH